MEVKDALRKWIDSQVSAYSNERNNHIESILRSALSLWFFDSVKVEIRITDRHSHTTTLYTPWESFKNAGGEALK